MKVLLGIILCLVLLCGAAVLGAQGPHWLWARGAGGTGNDEGYSIAIDSQGNQYVTGEFEGTATFGNYTLTVGGGGEDDNCDMFVAKLNPSGNWLWAIQVGGTGYDMGMDIAVDGSGNAYVTGTFEETVSFGSHSLTANGRSDLFVAKLSPSGNWLWAVKAGGPSYDIVSGIAVDGEGNIFVTGFFRFSASFGSFNLTATGEAGREDIFAAKLDSSGNWLWAVNAGGTYLDIAKGIAVDGEGNAYVTGSIVDTAIFGNHSLTSNGQHDIFVAKLSPSGNWLWATKAGGEEGDDGYSIVVDSSGNAYVTGYFTETATFGNHSLTANGDYDIFVAKLSPSGNWLWAVKAGGINIDEGYGIAIDGAGNAYVTGHFDGTAIFGSYSLIVNGFYDIFAAKLSPSGNWLWATKAGGTDYDYGYGYGIAIDGAGNAYVTGAFVGSFTFGSHTLTTSGEDEYCADIFVAKLGSGTPVEDDLAPQAVARLHSAYPNPLVRGTSTLIKAEIPERSTGTLSIFNLRGQMVASHKLGSGQQQVPFSGEGLPAGVYLYSLQCGDYQETKKLVLIK